MEPTPGVTLWSLRAAVTVDLLAVLAQPVLAGRYLTGDVDAIAVHRAVGSGLAALGLVTIGAALLHVTAGRGPLWVLPVAVGYFLALGLQLGMGFARQMRLHVPLGSVLVVGTVLLAIWVW
ncbi:MAG TPA: hypothetical protein VM367_16150, partial [Pseudonocardia sp.]|nr:hypothetical protein [Pseudonocardia sp.]